MVDGGNWITSGKIVVSWTMNPFGLPNPSMVNGILENR